MCKISEWTHPQSGCVARLKKSQQKQIWLKHLLQVCPQSHVCIYIFFYSVQIEDVISGKKKHPHVHPCASEAGLPPLRQWCFSVNSVIKPALLLLIQRWGGREGEGGREYAPRAWNCENRQGPGEHITGRI